MKDIKEALNIRYEITVHDCYNDWRIDESKQQLMGFS